jgi:DNA-binding SARP family transcriptional activator
MRGDTGASLQFGMLGPLEVRRDGKLLSIGGERQRALLALLLVHANELVTVDQLIDGLFGEQRSDSAVNAMRVAVSRLRRTLENGDSDDVLRTATGGYVLSTDPGQLDVALFERLLADGQQLLVVGDHRSAATRLRAALALWRGPALADLSLREFLQPEIRRSEELHLLAVMERIDADLGLEAAGELIGELELLVASNPLQERLRGQLMRALYRSGRQADALSVYRQTGELMRRELGLEPSRSLRQLEQAILRQDASLDAQHPPANQPGRCLRARIGRVSSRTTCARQGTMSAATLAHITFAPAPISPSGARKTNAFSTSSSTQHSIEPRAKPHSRSSSNAARLARAGCG